MQWEELQLSKELMHQAPLVSLMPLILMFVIFYFLLIKTTAEKAERSPKDDIRAKENDDIITTGGIHGTIVNVKPDTFTLRIDATTRIEIGKNFILGKKKIL